MNEPRAVEISTRGDRQIVIVREFEAEPSLVFEVMTRSDYLKRWLGGPPGWSMTECDNDPRPGGTFRHVWTGPNGEAMSMSGEYREVVAPERIVRTERFDFGCEAQAGEQIGVLELTESNGRTRMTLTVEYPSKEARDGALASGMEHGLAAGYAAVDSILAEHAG